MRRMNRVGRRRALAGGACTIALMAPLASLSCRSATAMTVVVTTDFPCADLRHVDIMVGALGDALEHDRSPTTTSSTCTDGYVGKLVIVPHGSDTDEVGIKIVAGFATRNAEECAPDGETPPGYGQGCIVERRALRYLPHTPLTVNVVLYADCDGVACGVTETCSHRRCVPAVIADPSLCAGAGCSDPVVTPGLDAGPPADTGAPSTDASIPDSIAATCGDVSGLQAGSPWPMSGFCPTRRSRSPYVGAQTSHVKWGFPAPPSSDVAIAADGTIYYGSYDSELHALDSRDPLGKEKWFFKTATSDAVLGSPAIAADGTVYFGAQDGNLYALYPDGTLRWQYACGDVVSAPNVGGDGTIYVSSKNRMVHAVRPDGSRRWAVPVGGSDQYAQPVLSVDGATLYVANFDGRLYTLKAADGSQVRYFETTVLAYPPAVGPDGTIYFGSGDKKLYALYPDGSQKWARPVGGAIDGPPALGADGVVCAPSDDGKVYAFASSGDAAWIYDSLRLTTYGPTIGGDGTVYFTAADGAGGGIYAVDSRGREKWKSEIYNLEASPAIGSDGTVYGDSAAFGP
jgi:outer membrane protein assembly factor BamB